MKLEVPYTQAVIRRPLIQLRLNGPQRTLLLDPVLVDSGSESSVFPLDDLPDVLGLNVYKRTKDGHEQRLRWRGIWHPLWFARLELEVIDVSGTCAFRWEAEVAFSSAPLKFPVLGQEGCMDLFNTDLRPGDQRVDFRAISSQVHMTTPTR